jgi:hypothetical protein
MNTSVPNTLIRASVQGIVYLIESASGRVFTYNLENPTFIGTLEKIPESQKHLISKTNGCLANVRVNYCENIRDIMTKLRGDIPPPSRWAPSP